MKSGFRDHGGGIDAAIQTYGGPRGAWIDLSTGINPRPYPLPKLSALAWTALPDRSAIEDLEQAAARFWQVPSSLEVVAGGGASALIAAIPHIFSGKTVHIPEPTYNEHWAAFSANGWAKCENGADVTVVVNPNNPTGRFWTLDEIQSAQCVIDESFCDLIPQSSILTSSAPDDRSKVVLKSFGKFWGLAGLRLGFAICAPKYARKLREQLGPWAVSGAACEIGSAALKDDAWARHTRTELDQSAARLDHLLSEAGFSVIGGTSLFRLADVGTAQRWFVQLAKAKILTRIFPYSDNWIRFGIPDTNEAWARLEHALKEPV